MDDSSSSVPATPQPLPGFCPESENHRHEFRFLNTQEHYGYGTARWSVYRFFCVFCLKMEDRQ